MKTFLQYVSTEATQRKWGRKSPNMTLRKESNWIPHIQVKQVSVFLHVIIHDVIWWNMTLCPLWETNRWNQSEIPGNKNKWLNSRSSDQWMNFSRCTASSWRWTAEFATTLANALNLSSSFICLMSVLVQSRMQFVYSCVSNITILILFCTSSKGVRSS